MKEIIAIEAAPKAIGPYSQGVLVKPFLYLSGQLPIDPGTGQLVESDIKIQTKRVLDNIQLILKASGMSVSNIVKTTIFLTNMNDFASVNNIYKEYFTEDYPARSTIEVSNLPKNALLEIEVIAYTG